MFPNHLESIELVEELDSLSRSTNLAVDIGPAVVAALALAGDPLHAGKFLYVFPPEHARWGTKDQEEIRFKLYAQKGKLKGFFKPPVGAIHIELEKAAL